MGMGQTLSTHAYMQAKHSYKARQMIKEKNQSLESRHHGSQHCSENTPGDLR